MADVVNKTYFIKKGYKHRNSYTHYSDIGYEDEYQDEVYKTALRIMEENNLRRVFDVGCGSAFKLIKHFSNYDFIGAEIPPTLEWLAERYPNFNWVESDFNKPVETDLFICSDVIEHLVDPDELIGFFKQSQYKFIVLSTPERDGVQRLQRGCLWDGPPANRAHTREWNFLEFKNYISSHFNVVEHFMAKNKVEPIPLCQVVVVENEF